MTTTAPLYQAIKKLLPKNPSAIAGFAFSLVWVFMASHHLSIALPITAFGGLSARCALLLGTAFGCLFLFVYTRKGFFPETREIGGAVGLMTIGFLLYSLPDSMEVPELLSVACVFLSGFGYGILFLSWIANLRTTGSKESLIFFGLAILIASGIDAVLISLPFYLVLAAMICLPALSMTLYLRTTSRTPPLASDPLDPKTKVRNKGALIAVVTSLFIQGFAYGAFIEYVFILNTTLENVVGVFALAIAAGLLLCSAAFLSWLLQHKGVLFACFILLALGYSCIPLFSGDIKLVVFMLMLTYNFFYFIAVALCRVFSERSRVPFFTCAIVVIFLFSGGSALGSLFSGAFAGLLETGAFITVMSIAVAYSFFICAFVVIQYFFTAEENGSVQAAQGEVRIGRFVKTHRLSHRETDVFGLLVKGRTATVIAEKLFISPETVRVHIKNIYKKTDVHSQQQLIEVVECYIADDPSPNTSSTDARQDNHVRERRKG